MATLCDEKTIDSMIILEDLVYVFRLDNYWVFSLKGYKPNKALGDLPLIEANVDINSKWKAIDGTKSKFTIHENKFVAISGDIWMQLSSYLKISSHKILFDEKSIETEQKYRNIPYIEKSWAELKDSQMPTGDKLNSEESIKGAFFKIKGDSYGLISGEKFYTYHVENNQWFKSRPIPVRKSEFKFPQNINAVFESFDGYFYFIRKDKYCKRKLEDTNGVCFAFWSFVNHLIHLLIIQCKEWYLLKLLFGCVVNYKLEPNKDVCEEKTIDAMFIFENRIFIFHNDKFWIYEMNVQNSVKPLGQLIEGNMKIDYKWKGIIGHKSKFAIHYNRIIAITGLKWMELEANGEISKSGSITYEKGITDGTDNEGTEEVLDKSEPSDTQDDNQEHTESGVST